MIPRLVAKRAVQNNIFHASTKKDASVTVLTCRNKINPRKLISNFSTTPLKGQGGHKTYFQPGDQPIVARQSPQYQYQPESSTTPLQPQQHVQSELLTRSQRVFRTTRWLVLSWIGFVVFTSLLGQLLRSGYLPGSQDISLTLLSIEHDKAASGIMELFSLVLLHIRNTGTLWDSYRDMELLEQVPLILADGTRATNNNAAVVRVVDALGRTRFLVLAVDTTEPRPLFLRKGSSWVSDSTPIQQWLLQLSNRIYTESNGEAVGLTLGYFTRDTMGFGPVGTDVVGGRVLLQCFGYDAEDEAGFGSMVDVLKDVKVEKEELPELEKEDEEDEQERKIGADEKDRP